jgi:hypothetical protein
MLARIAREKPSFLAGYERVCEGAGLVLYRRVPKGATMERTETDRSHGTY